MIIVYNGPVIQISFAPNELSEKDGSEYNVIPSDQFK